MKTRMTCIGHASNGRLLFSMMAIAVLLQMDNHTLFCGESLLIIKEPVFSYRMDQRDPSVRLISNSRPFNNTMTWDAGDNDKQKWNEFWKDQFDVIEAPSRYFLESRWIKTPPFLEFHEYPMEMFPKTRLRINYKVFNDDIRIYDNLQGSRKLSLISVYSLSGKRELFRVECNPNSSTFFIENSDERLFYVEEFDDRDNPVSGLRKRNYKFFEINVKGKKSTELFMYSSPWGGAPAGDIRITADGAMAFLFGDDYSITILDMKNGKVIKHFDKIPRLTVDRGAITPDGRYAYGIGGGFVTMWDMENGQMLCRKILSPNGRKNNASNPAGIQISPDSKWLAIGTGPIGNGPTGDVYLLSTKDLSIKRIYKHGGQAVIYGNLVFSPHTPHLATSTGGVIKIWELPSNP